MKKVGFWVILFSVLLSGCEKIALRDDNTGTHTEIFEFLWTDLHQRYSYFQEKNIDWQAVKLKYSAQIHEQLDEYELFDILSELLFELEDGHVNLVSSFNRSRNWTWFENYPVNYQEQLIYDHYLKTDYKIIGPLLAQSVQDILYVSIRSFDKTLSHQHMDEIIRLMSFHNGLIIDIRNNGGGSLQNAQIMASRFVDSTWTYGQQRLKSGPDISDFTPWIPMQIFPGKGDKYKGKIAVLCNRRSYSTSTFFAQMMKVLPQARIFGDQTGGGGGIPVFAELPNGWTYRFSASQTTDMEGNHIEFGVRPDFYIMLQASDLASGKDSIIEAAISWLND
jgi:hypothetical protein